ncbi:hypothetical protein [Paenibacillus aceris]|uniref:ACT domain-containing protein n=1 Tax=Paenibacillus aceris TaxID=869555 RepID=A0ABS4HWM0_9BACL|nr:hypothetical protein [Paenibacillus aceris]MBP1962900.1 hypothetical protein [Paenibacillus aceris]NHW38327.1 hypothetical protein [Paenibacillus aceris]
MKFSFSIRTQFRFVAKDRTLSCILASIARQHVNLTALVVIKKHNRMNSIRLVVGSPTAESASDLRIVRSVLRSFGVTFQEEKVVQVRNIVPNVPGVSNSIYGALWCRVKVKAVYDGEQNASFLNVSDVKKTIRILSQKNVRQCPKNCRRCG